MNRAQKRARRNVTRKNGERKKKNAQKAGKEREFEVILHRWANGGVTHANEKATVFANPRRLTGRFTTIKVKSESQRIKWVTNSWSYVGDHQKKKKVAAAAPKKKAPAAKKDKKVAAKPAAKPATH